MEGRSVTIEDSGTKTIPAGSLAPVEVAFNLEFPVNPTVSAAAEDSSEYAYLILEDVTTTGFTVRWNMTRPGDRLVMWSASSPDPEELALLAADTAPPEEPG